MKKRVFAALMAGVMGTMMFGTTFVSAEAETPELKGEVNAFIAASLYNAMPLAGAVALRDFMHQFEQEI